MVEATVRFSAASKDSPTAELLLRGDLHLHATEYLIDEFDEVADALDRGFEALAYYSDHPDAMRELRDREATALDELESLAIEPPMAP